MKDLGLDINITPGRRRRVDVVATVVRELMEADLILLGGEERGIKPVNLKRISERHKKLAKVLAEGAKPSDAAYLCNFTPSRVSLLLGDPAFAELVEFEKSRLDEAYITTHEVFASVAKDAALELSDRLEEDPEDFSTGQLIELATRFGDRSGNGPTATQNVNHNINLGDRLELARKRALMAARGEVIEAEIIEESKDGVQTS